MTDIISDPQSQSSYNLSSITSVANVEIGRTDYNQRILARQVSTGALRGVLSVGRNGGVKIDSSNNQITIGSVTDSLGERAETVLGKLSSTDQSFGLKVIDSHGGQLLIGVLPDGKLGIQLLDAQGNEVMRSGLMPTLNIYGWATATPGNTLEGQI